MYQHTSLLFLLFQLCVTTTGLPLENNTSSQVDGNDTLPWTLSTTSLPSEMNNEASVRQDYDLSRSQKTTRDRILYITEHVDYDNDSYEGEDDDYEVLTVPPHFSGDACPYDRCKHLQPPCEEIQKMAGGKCLCPGISGSSVLPDSPRLRQVVPQKAGIELSWCAPLSTVQTYKVIYGPPEGPLEMGPLLNQSYRFFYITNLLPGTAYRVCVVAMNDAGESQVELEDGDEELNQEDRVGPCGIFHTSQGSSLYVAIGVGLVLLACILGGSALIYWFWCKKKVRRIKRSRQGDIGVTNMSFKAESIENL
ncbi:LRRN4 C-terminal-like protein [Engystomops pustulosus]|uniref:LRRN4 C-terminal-like protein n=1 Tax=Engystomops pustulosus TaxID=76066 RepID=UPI003AFB074F